MKNFVEKLNKTMSCDIFYKNSLNYDSDIPSNDENRLIFTDVLPVSTKYSDKVEHRFSKRNNSIVSNTSIDLKTIVFPSIDFLSDLGESSDDDNKSDHVSRRRLTIESLSSLYAISFPNEENAKNSDRITRIGIENLEENLNFEFYNNPLNSILLKEKRYIKGNDISEDEYRTYISNKACCGIPSNGIMRQFSSIEKVDQDFLQPFIDGKVNLKEIFVGGAGYSKWFIFRNNSSDCWIVSMSVDTYVLLCKLRSSPGYETRTRIEFRQTSIKGIISLLWGVPYNKDKIVVDRNLLNCSI